MRLRLGVPHNANEDEKKAILDAALESVTRADMAQLANGVPSFIEALHGQAPRGVRWRPEPPGDEHFDLASTVIRRGWGDCDDLAPWHAASLRASGEDPEAAAVVRRSGPNRWHAVVQRHDGTIDDPSRAAGMGVVGGHDDHYAGAFWPSMFGDRLALASSPLAPGRGFGGRIDVPSQLAPFVYSALARGSGPRGAIIGACEGALDVCGDDADHFDMLRIAGIHDLLCGADPEEVAEEMFDHTENVGFFGALLPAAASFAAPIASSVLSKAGILPGGGGGAPASAPGGAAISPAASQAPGSCLHTPGGPIIVRF